MARIIALLIVLALSACKTTNNTAMPDPGSRTAPTVEQSAPEPRVDPASMTCDEIREAMTDRATVMAEANRDMVTATVAKTFAGQIPFAGGAISAGLNEPWFRSREAVIDFAMLAIEGMFRCRATRMAGG